MITDCGAANLLAAVFGEDSDMIKRTMGIPSRLKPCVVCGKLTKSKWRWCSPECRHEYSLIQVSCHQCGRLFKRNAKELVWVMNHNNPLSGKPIQHLFCSKECRGRWMGLHHKPRHSKICCVYFENGDGI